MKEVQDHKAYELLETKYSRVGLDYVILSVDEADEAAREVAGVAGADLHRRAILEAFRVLDQRFSSFGGSFDVDESKMASTAIEVRELLQLPPDVYDKASSDVVRSFSAPTPMPYWFAFLEPPQGTPYQTQDFVEFNQVLFPNPEELEVFRWNDGFSNYFDAGKEWWGTGLWTAYDNSAGVLVVIGASLTD